MTKFSSRIIGKDAFVIDDSFKFNCKIEKVEFSKLSKEELSKQVAKYQRADGQYVFNGVFLPMEEIFKIVDNKFVILTIVIKHNVISSENVVYELMPYSKSENDF